MLVATHELDVDSGSDQVYNALDCALTHEIFSELKKQSSQAAPAYGFELALQAPVLEMMLRGMRVDPGARELGINATKKSLERLDYILQTLANAVWSKGLNPNSGKQLKEFFYEHLGVHPIVTWVKGERKEPMDRKVLEKIEDYFQARPIVAAILAHRDLDKTLQVLEKEVDPDWRMRTSYNIGGTKSARFSSSASTTGTGCVLPSTEVLTPSGWKRIDQVRDGSLIMQWIRERNALEFVPCTIHVQDFSGEMYKAKTEQMLQTLTPDHRVIHYDSRMIHSAVSPAKDVALLSQSAIPLGGHYIGAYFEIPAYAAMLMADFSIEDNGWRGEFSKARKINRFLHLARENKIDYTENKARPGCRRFRVSGQQHIPKKWGPWILDLTASSAVNLLEEARHWDSHDRGSGFIFSTADEEQATWFATLAHIVGRAATIRRTEQSAGSYSNTVMWNVNVKDRCHSRVQRHHWETVSYTGKVYCPQVPSSFWLMREDKFISVTGNTNMQNITEDLRHIFIADPGYVLYNIDAEQSDSRMVGYMCGLLFDDWTYLDACESSDLHTTVARMVWTNELPWTGDMKRDRKIADQNFHRHFSYRDCCKRIGHGRNFLGKPDTLSKETAVPKNLVIDFCEKYDDAFPGIRKWQIWTANQLQEHQQLITIHGRKRDFFDRTDADETIRKGLAFLAAAPTADNINLGMWRVWRYMPQVQLLGQVHDSILFQAKESEDKATIAAEAQRLLTTELTAPSGRKFVVPTEVKIGYNWGNYIPPDEEKGTPEKNPRGLRKFRAL
jgi:hypothetical protein